MFECSKVGGRIREMDNMNDSGDFQTDLADMEEISRIAWEIEEGRLDELLQCA